MARNRRQIGLSSQPWYKRDVILAAVIGAVGAVVVALIGLFGVYLPARRSAPPPLEIKTIAAGAERVLSRIALDPREALTDSSSFRRLKEEYVLLSDTFGIAMLRPEGYEWTAGYVGELDGISPEEFPLIGARIELVEKALDLDSVPLVRFYGVHLDKPVEVQLDARSSYDGTRIGSNPYDNPAIVDASLRLWDPDGELTLVERVALRYHWNNEMDSLIRARLPAKKSVKTGVFVAGVRRDDMARVWAYFWPMSTPFEMLVWSQASTVPSPSFLYVDREKGIATFNGSVVLREVLVDGIATPEVVYNRVGYIVQSGELTYLVVLRYFSHQGEATLNALLRYFDSVKLRVAPEAHEAADEVHPSSRSDPPPQ